MKTEILSNLDNPHGLEKLYRDNKPAFRREFNALYPELRDTNLATYWHERLNYDHENVFPINRAELVFVALAALIAGICAKLPEIFSINEEFFYTRNIGFLVFPFLTAYFVWKNKLSGNKIMILAGVMALAMVFINLLPDNPQSDTLVLSCIHLGLFLWATTGFAFVGEEISNFRKRLGYLSYNGDLVVICALLLISGAS